MNHATVALIRSYAHGEALSAEVTWSLEVHLESCSSCRARLAEVVPAEVAGVVDQVWQTLTPLPAASGPVRRRRWLAAWIPPAVVSWIVGATIVIVLAIFFGTRTDWLNHGNLLYLLAPVLPVLGVAAAWSRGLDPMYELVVATPRAGLSLLLRRTVAVLAIVLPVLAGTSAIVGVSPMLWLLPSLGCTLSSLALGSVFRVERAALGVAAGWLAVFTPEILRSVTVPLAYAQWSVPAWAGVIVLAAVVLVLRGTAFTRILVEQKEGPRWHA